MDKKEIIEMVSKLLKFAKDEAPAAAPAAEGEKPKEVVKASDVKTKDGIVLTSTAEKWDVGVDVAILNEDGSTSEAKDDTYELEDGSKLVVEGGKVKEIIAIEEAPAEEVAEEEMAQNFSKELKDRDEAFKRLEEKFTKVLEATAVLTEAFSKLPVSDKINLSATSASDEEFSKTKTLSKREKNLKEIYSVLEEIKSEQNNKNKK